MVIPPLCKFHPFANLTLYIAHTAQPSRQISIYFGFMIYQHQEQSYKALIVLSHKTFFSSKFDSIQPLLQRRGLYNALSYGFSACSGVLKITIHCVQKLGTVKQTADRCTPSDSQAHSLPHQGDRDCYSAIEHLGFGNVLGIQETFFLRAIREDIPGA